jgi:hypothetical protein
VEMDTCDFHTARGTIILQAFAGNLFPSAANIA